MPNRTTHDQCGTGPPLSQTLEWMGLRLRVPEDWQLVRHGLSPEAGRLVLVDRRAQRLTLWWTQCQKRPDLRRMVHDYRQQCLVDTPGCRIEPFTYAGQWQGFSQTAHGSLEVLTRAVSFHTETSRLIEALVVGHQDRLQDRQLVKRLLHEVHVTAAAQHSTRWKAFDIELLTPLHLRLVRTDIKPADATLVFSRVEPASGKRTRAEAQVRRLGMADAWYAGDLRHLLRRSQPGTEFRKLRDCTHRGWRALLAEGFEPGPRLKRALGLLRTQRVLAWECETENAVYELSTKSFASYPLAPADLVVCSATAENHGQPS